MRVTVYVHGSKEAIEACKALASGLYGVCWAMASDAADWDWNGLESPDDVQRRVARWRDPDGRDPWWRYSRAFPLWALEQCKPGKWRLP